MILELSLFLSLGVLTLWTFSNTIIKKVSVQLGTYRTSSIVVGLGIFPMLIAILVERPLFHYSSFLLLSLVSGVMLGAGYILFYKALEKEKVSSAGVMFNLQQIIVISIGILFLKENSGPYTYIGITLIIMGALLVSVNRNVKINRILLLAAAANIIWGLYYIPLSRAIFAVHFSTTPLILARIVGFFIITIIFLPRIMKARKKPNTEKQGRYRSVLALGVLAGLLDGSANVVYASAISGDFIVLAGSIVAILPATIAISGVLFFREKLTAIQAFGIILAIAGALVISLI
ncbi:DMT family transporter [Oxyplasma meridianum]|uniref:DMT family transporter n=1 Tax=Oxyplasma meridianum TaxID=3073602 RepID=A0AAX4NFI8_9ARCH